ncbi:MAG: hypothetical protein LBI44_01150 [Oscillospiraceae bacterium]|jgi:hypothetical protein|nr:hypothetical protein [Oscillospiraceae bacterium]
MERKRKRARRPKKKTFTPLFTAIFATLIVVCGAVVFAGLTRLWRQLDAYEKSLPYNYSDAIFERYFAGDIDYRLFYITEKQNISPLEPYDNFQKSLAASVGSGARSYVSVRSDDPAVLKYAVLSGEAKFAEFEMTHTNIHGAATWELSAMRIFYQKLEDFKITVSAEATAYVNGLPLGEEYVTARAAADPICGEQLTYTVRNMLFEPTVAVAYPNGEQVAPYYREDIDAYAHERAFTADLLTGWALTVNGEELGEQYLTAEDIATPETSRLRLSRKQYAYSGSFGKLTVTAADGFGREYALRERGEFDYYMDIPYSPELAPTVGEFSKNATTAYCEYLTRDSTMENIRKYFQTGTATYEGIRTSEVSAYTNHIGYHFERVEASEMYYHGESLYSCRVTLDHYVHRTASDIRHFPLDVTLFIVENNGKYLVRDLVSNA